MAEDKNKTDSDRIKELLAQLRATMDLEEVSPAPTEVEETPAEEGYETTLEELLSIGNEEDSDASEEQDTTTGSYVESGSSPAEDQCCEAECEDDAPSDSVARRSREKKVTILLKNKMIMKRLN